MGSCECSEVWGAGRVLGSTQEAGGSGSEPLGGLGHFFASDPREGVGTL